MKSTIRSVPKMRRTYTPRIKSAQLIQEQNLNTAQMLRSTINSQELQTNPETSNSNIKRKLSLAEDVPNGNQKDYHTASKNIVNENKNNFSPNNNKNWKQKQAQKLTVNNKIQVYDFQNEEKTKAHQRAQSACSVSSKRSFSEKSQGIKARQRQKEQKFNVAFDYLLQSKTGNLSQKKGLQPRKTLVNSREKLQFRKSFLNTTNSTFYKATHDKHKLTIQPQNLKDSLMISPSQVCGSSTSKDFFKGRKGQTQKKTQYPQGFKLQGPIYNMTTSQNAFPNHGNFEKMLPIATFNEHPLGMKYKGSTTHNQFFKGEYCPRSQLATWNNLKPIGNDFSPQRGTLYENFFGPKQKHPSQAWPLPEHQLTTKSFKNLETEYKRNLGGTSASRFL